MNGDRQARRKPRALARLAALSALVTIALGACATRHNALPPPQEHGRVGVTDQQSAMPGTKQATLGTTRLKRRVKILEHGALAAATSVDEHEAALLAAARREIEQRVTNEWNLAVALRAQLPHTADLVGATREVVDSYMRQYTVGRKSWIDVLNAQRELTQALYSQADARTGALASTVRLRILVGDHERRAESGDER